MTVARSLYVHIPFCRRRCFYCDFAITTASTTGGQDLQVVYVEALCQEIQLTAATWGANSLDTVFFGGGTPSLLSVEQVDRILQAIAQNFGINSGAEISLEANPGTVTVESLRGYGASGINRISLGAQAFQAHLLDLCGRGHGVPEIWAAVEAITQAGFANFSLDLISGLPNQTIDHWQDSLEQAMRLEPSHISVYDLIVEPGTAFFKRYQPGDRPLPSEAATVDMYLLARTTLQKAGFRHYEISNYAQPGYECRHNLVYWQNLPFYGVGMGATSYIDGKRSDRPRKLRDYLTMVASQQLPDSDRLTLAEQLFETLMQGLRLAEGLELEMLQVKFGSDLCEAMLEILTRREFCDWVQVGDRLQLVQPQGWLFSDQVIERLYDLVGDTYVLAR